MSRSAQDSIRDRVSLVRAIAALQKAMLVVMQNSSLPEAAVDDIKASLLETSNAISAVMERAEKELNDGGGG